MKKALRPLAFLLLAMVFSPSAYAANNGSYSISCSSNNIAVDGVKATATANSAGNVDLGDISGTTITLDLTYKITKTGNPAAPSNPTATFGIPVSGQSGNAMSNLPSPSAITIGSNTAFPPASYSLSTPFSYGSDITVGTVSIPVPQTPGSYYVWLGADSCSFISNLGGGSRFQVTFNVTEPACPQVATALTLTATPACIIYHTATTMLTATLSTLPSLSSTATGLSGKAVKFEFTGPIVTGKANAVDAQVTLDTDESGNAVWTCDTSTLKVGDYDITATYAGDGCEYTGSTASTVLGVKYDFKGFQPPITRPSIAQFKGTCIPVKIKIADVNGNAVTPDADGAAPRISYAFGTPATMGIDATDATAVQNGDTGNIMRYDSLADQYIFNWDISNAITGTYTIFVDMGEGSCASDPDRCATVSIKRK